MRKYILVGIILFSSIFLSGCSLKKSSGNVNEVSEAKPTSFPTKPIEESIKTRPFISLLPSSDGHWITLEIKNVSKGVSGLEYDLIYFAEVEGNRIERGVSTSGSPVDLSGQFEFSKKILLGSASCTTGTCKYKYDEGVNEGSLSLSLIGSNKEKFETVYRIQKGKEAKDGLTTGDGVFSFVSSSLSPTQIYLTTSSIGVPVQLPSGVVPKSIPYGIYSPGSLKSGTVSFKTSLEKASIYAFDNKSWSKLSTEISGGLAKANSSGQNIFILAD